MILILSEEFDYPTACVVSKLEERKANFKVLYGSNFINTKISINVEQRKIYYNCEELLDVNIVWYRRWLSSQRRSITGRDIRSS